MKNILRYLEILRSHPQLLKSHEERIHQLATSNAQLIRGNKDLRREIESLKVDSRTPSGVISPYIPNDTITISGVPLTVSDFPQIITERVFGALGVAGLAGDILEVRSIDRRVDLNANRVLGRVSLVKVSD